MNSNTNTRGSRRRWRVLWIGSGAVAGLVAGLVLSQTVELRLKGGSDGDGDGDGRSTLIFPSPSLAHAAQGGKQVLFSVADVAERSLASVVSVSTTRASTAQRSPYYNDPFFREFFRQFGPQRELKPQQGLGSGVIVRSDGIVITNNHVVKGASKIRVTLSNKREYTAKVVGTDPKSDLAVLRLKGAKGLKPVRFGDSDKLRLGDVVLAVGNPFGVGQTVTMGIVSAKGRANMRIVDYEDFIQTDAAINPGNSGGAMINLRGELVGINTAILSRSGGYMGIGFAIPSNMVRPIMNSLLKRGKVVRGWLGVVIQEVNRELQRAMRLPTRKGVLIADVDPRGPAHKAGLKRGDLVVRLNGKTVSTTGRLRNLVATAGPSATVKLELYRRGRLQTLNVKLAEQPSALFGGGAKTASTSAGISVGPLGRQNRNKYNISPRLKYGVVVESVDPNSSAAHAGLRSGDVILEVNRAKIISVRRFSQTFNAARGQVLLLVYRSGSAFFMILDKR